MHHSQEEQENILRINYLQIRIFKEHVFKHYYEKNKGYIEEFETFVKSFLKRRITSLSPLMINSYLVTTSSLRKLDDEQKEQIKTVLQIYYTQCKNYDVDFLKAKNYDEVISQILAVQDNVKHQLMFFLYLLFPKCEWLINLELKNITFVDNNTIIRALNEKITFSDHVIEKLFLRYINHYKPQRYLFEGRNQNQMTETSLYASMHLTLKSNIQHGHIKLKELLKSDHSIKIDDNGHVDLPKEILAALL